ncbi:hypothetical protein ACFSTC_29280 [Nonomuraea ferruginea]
MHELKADCASCSGLCCVALPFSRSADFAVDKAAERAVPQPPRRLPLRHPPRPAPRGLPRLRGLRLLRRQPEGHPGRVRGSRLAAAARVRP